MLFTTMNIEADTLSVMSNKQLFADWLVDALKSRAWSQADLMRKSGLSRAAISNYCNGFRIPDQESMLALAAALDYPPAELYRIAGILPDRDDAVMTETDKEMLYLFMTLPEKDKHELIQLARIKKNLDKQRLWPGEQDNEPKGAK